ncbi:unnamed protein product [Parajaminaea phylloscopi]
MFLHTLPPPPAPLDFSAALIPTSASTVTPLHLGKATQHRQVLRSLLASHHAARTQAQSGSSASPVAPIEVKLIQAIDDYLPCLVAVLNSCRTDELVWRANHADATAASTHGPFVWWPLLAVPGGSSSQSSSKGSKGPHASSSILFELDSVLVLYSLALSNLAVLQSIAVSTYEYTNCTLSEDDRKAKEGSLKRGVTWGRKAVAVIRWLIDNEGLLLAPGTAPEEVGDDWNQEREASRRRMLAGLLSFHQLAPTLLTLRILLSPTQAHLTTSRTTMPPLPRGHPSPALLAKLYLEIPRIADEARGELQAATGSGLHHNGIDSSASSRLTNKFKNFSIGGSSGSGRDAGLSQSRLSASRPVSHGKADLGGGGTGPPLARGHASQGEPEDVSKKSNGGRLRSNQDVMAQPIYCPISAELFRYLDAISSYARAAAFMYLALAAAEGAGGATDDGTGSATGGKYGEAIVWLRLSREELLREDDTSGDRAATMNKAWAEWIGKKAAYKQLGKLLALEEFSGNGKRQKEAKEPRKGGLLNAVKSAKSARSTSPNGRDEPNSALDENDGDTQTATTSSSHPLAPRLAAYHYHVLLESLAPLLCHLAKTYTALNNTVTFQPLPSKADLQQRVPGSRAVLTFEVGEGSVAPSNPNVWRPPRAEFGPQGYEAGRAGEPLPRGMGLILDGGAGPEDGAGAENSAGYAGRGAYY